MKFVAKTAHSGKFSFTLGELIDGYKKPKETGCEHSYICFMLDEMGSRYFKRNDGVRNDGCLADDSITVQFRAAWCEKVLGGCVDTGDQTIENWNKGTRYGVESYGWDSLEDYSNNCSKDVRRNYRLSMMEDVLATKGDIEFTIDVWVHSSLRHFFD
jgi:hypothetical protein